MILAHFAKLGESLLDSLESLGRFFRFAGRTGEAMVRSCGRWARPSILFPQFYEVGTRSIPVVMLVGAFVGMVLVVEMYEQFRLLGQETRLGGVIGLSVVKQIGPVLAAVMIAGRVGGSVSAELGTMRVTEQLDAMRVIGVDPIAYLVAPRVVACILMVPLLTVVSNILGIAGGYLVSVQLYGINERDYWAFTAEFVLAWDLFTGLLKAVFFGMWIGLVSTYKGFYCDPGAEGVGKAATSSFVVSFIAIIITNFVLATFLNNLYFALEGVIITR
ncbi:MAG: ABC transporter permease [Phycisphaeraceae bacterium]|nr:ABC transporter permease [Phycisphaeraceae bacterium]